MVSKRANTIFTAALSVPLGWMLGCCVETALVYDAHLSRKPEVEALITADLPLRVHEVEQFWGQKYDMKPVLRFELTDAERTNAGLGMLALGLHRYGENDLYISSGVVASEEDSLVEKIELWCIDGLSPKTTVQHELTHALVSQISYEKNCTIDMSEKKNHVIQEGIATYAEIGLGSQERDIDCTAPRPTDIEKFHNYSDGYCFVKTILDQDKVGGLTYLLCDPPWVEDVLNPAAYYARFKDGTKR